MDITKEFTSYYTNHLYKPSSHIDYYSQRINSSLTPYVLEEKYGSSVGVAVTEKLDVPIGFENVVSKAGVKLDGDAVKFDSEGIIHPFQERGAISTLDYQQLAQLSYEANRGKIVSAMFGGATQSAQATALVNFWSLFTLFPRLGIRSSIDEGDDWQDKKNWTKSNPNLGVTPYISYMDDQYQKALNEGAAKQIQFMTKNLSLKHFLFKLLK